MATELPYLASYKNVGELFQKISSARKPEVFTTRYLTETLGLKSTTDRQLITLLKTLGFLDSAGRPTNEYDQLKNPARAPKGIGSAVRRAFEALYAANERAHDLQNSELKGLISQVAGSDTGVTSKIQGTFTSLAKLADFNEDNEIMVDDATHIKIPAIESTYSQERVIQGSARLRSEFHYNIQVHLPANATEETYLNIFNALRKSFE